MAQVETLRVGQPLKYPGGWSSANKLIYLSESAYERWQSLRAALVFGAIMTLLNTFWATVQVRHDNYLTWALAIDFFNYYRVVNLLFIPQYHGSMNRCLCKLTFMLYKILINIANYQPYILVCKYPWVWCSFCQHTRIELIMYYCAGLICPLHHKGDMAPQSIALHQNPIRDCDVTWMVNTHHMCVHICYQNIKMGCLCIALIWTYQNMAVKH